MLGTYIDNGQHHDDDISCYLLENITFKLNYLCDIIESEREIVGWSSATIQHHPTISRIGTQLAWI